MQISGSVSGALALALSFASTPALAVDHTTSPDRRYVVFIDRGEMFVKRLGTRKQVRVGRGLPVPCCELVDDITGKGLEAYVRLHDGAYWTRPGVPWAKGRRLVLVRAADTYWFLSMDGELHGDV